ncbi:MAG TPA: hypothetical protein VGK25_07145 [Ignavibacteria bacterium]|jgi:hypothetical protein
MRTVKNFKILTITLAMIVIVAAGFKIVSASKRVTRNGEPVSFQLSENGSFKGSSEFYFKPEGDKRLWHVVNMYSSKPLNDSDYFNNSIYTFSQDSVEVINSYLLTPDNGKLSFDLISLDLASAANNYNN